MYGSNRHSAPATEKRRSSRIVIIESTGKRVLEQSRLRLACVALVFLCSFCAIAVRLVDVSTRGLFDSSINTLADYRATKPVHPRAEILDRNGEVLATTLRTASLYANPKLLREPVVIAEQLKKALPDIDEKQIAKRLSSDRSFVWIKRHLTPKEQKIINDMGVPGLNFEPEYKRIYPQANLFAHVLGYVDVDSKGMAGIERGFEEFLRDEDGHAEPLKLSVDMRVQAILQEELQASIKEFRAIGGAGVVMDITTGEVVAMTSLPDFDPHEPGKADADARFNRATMGVYEMGSTFKTFTMAVALESGVANMRSSYDATKPIRVARFTINDSHPENRWLTVPEIFAYSSNIGTVKMVMDVGSKRQQSFMKKLGMLDAVEMEIPEVADPLLPDPWREINTMTISYGHGIAVTPVHLVRAIASITGKGNLLPVTFVKDGNMGKPTGERILSEANVVNVRKLLRLVVEHGTGSKSNAQGYRVGGKTGTAEKLGNGGGYKADSKMASFVGVFPIDDPRYAVLVMVDEPKGTKKTWGYATGGWVSAPVVGNFVSRVGPLLGIRPIYEVPQQKSAKAKNNKSWVYYDGGAVHAISF
ncbi:MAG: penicillin-binding protein 2 [Alphaproteobacteria bacterium]|nr:penicillin-binding protein 2 [Alphaproteobacteria bacterium]